jgi:hypothetical protein
MHGYDRCLVDVFCRFSSRPTLIATPMGRPGPVQAACRRLGGLSLHKSQQPFDVVHLADTWLI